MLEEPCPYHKGGANHKLKDYRMLKKHFDGLGFKKDARDDPKKEKGGDKEDNKDDDGFPAVHDCYMIYGGPSTQLTARQRKRERREVFTARIETLGSFLVLIVMTMVLIVSHLVTMAKARSKGLVKLLYPMT